jgi:hypothetical protein
MEKQNREQRRHAKFGGGRANEQAPWPTTEPNPVFGAGDAPDEATAGRPDQNQVKDTGAGTGGATEEAGRAPRHEGTHPGNSTKG